MARESSATNTNGCGEAAENMAMFTMTKQGEHYQTTVIPQTVAHWSATKSNFNIASPKFLPYRGA